MNESNTLKLNGLGIVWNMKGQVLVISKTSSVLVVDKLFPRSDDGLGKVQTEFLHLHVQVLLYRVLDLNELEQY